MEKPQIITKRLQDLGESYDDIKDFLKEHLDKIESIISEKREQQREAIEILSKKPFSVKSIAEELDYSRTTLYNHNQLLMRYIEVSKEEFEKNNPFNEVKRLREEMENLNTKLYKMYGRDVKVENLNIEINSLQYDIKTKNDEIMRLRKRVYELSEENHTLKLGQQNQSGASEVVKFKRKER